METNYLQDIDFKKSDVSSYMPTDPNGLERPCLLCAVGPPARGKTYALCQLIQDQIRNKEIDKLYICSPTYHNNKHYFEDMDIKKEICDDMNESFGFIEKLKTEQLKIKEIWKEIHKQFPTVEEWLKYFKIMNKNEEIKRAATLRTAIVKTHPFTLEEAAKKYMKDNKIEEKKDLLTESEYIIEQVKFKGSPEAYYEKPPIVLLFCDDIQGSKLMSNSKKNPFINFIIKFRHFFTSVFFGVHSISNGLPVVVRAAITDWLVFKVDDPKLIQKIHSEAFGSIGDPDEFEDMFKNMVDGDTHRFLSTHKKKNPMQARLNWNVIFNDAREMLAPFKKPEKKHSISNEQEFEFNDSQGNRKKLKVNI